jgi:hypothetical protein
MEKWLSINNLNRFLLFNKNLGTISYSTKTYSARATVIKSNFDYTIDVVKKNDYNTYLSTLLSPEQVLRAAFALKAFNIELLSMYRSSLDTKSQISLIKLQFWKVRLLFLFCIEIDLDLRLQILFF